MSSIILDHKYNKCFDPITYKRLMFNGKNQTEFQIHNTYINVVVAFDVNFKVSINLNFYNSL